MPDNKTGEQDNKIGNEMEAEQREELRRLADQSSRGEWFAKKIDDEHLVLQGVYTVAQCFSHVGDTGPADTCRRNSTFIAAANPSAITALLDELDDTEKAYALLFAENARLRAELEAIAQAAQQSQPLTDEQIMDIQGKYVGGPTPSFPLDTSDWLQFARAIEAAHNIKGVTE